MHSSVAQLTMNATSKMDRFFLGCPAWAYPRWRGSVFDRNTKSADFLARYSEIFNAVEGNSSFYALPSAAQIANWRAAVSDQFRFCFKFPRQISHDLKLQNARAQTLEFLQRLSPLGACMGPLLLQLGPDFAPTDLPILDRFLSELGQAFQVAVEVRHPLFYFNQMQTPQNFASFTAELDGELALNELLLKHKSHRCHFDTQCVHRAASVDASTMESQRRKPKLPRRTSMVGDAGMFRIVGQNALTDVDPEIDFFAPFFCAYLGKGENRSVCVYTYT
jgi:uncharacterized protein YecE (DUF72 family)